MELNNKYYYLLRKRKRHKLFIFLCIHILYQQWAMESPNQVRVILWSNYTLNFRDRCVSGECMDFRNK